MRRWHHCVTRATVRTTNPTPTCTTTRRVVCADEDNVHVCVCADNWGHDRNLLDLIPSLHVSSPKRKGNEDGTRLPATTRDSIPVNASNDTSANALQANTTEDPSEARPSRGESSAPQERRHSLITNGIAIGETLELITNTYVGWFRCWRLGRGGD